MATVRIYPTRGFRGEAVTLSVAFKLSSLELPHRAVFGNPVRSIQANFRYDPSILGEPNATSAIPTLFGDNPWLFAANSPIPGELRTTAVDLDGSGMLFQGRIFSLSFHIDPKAPLGKTPIDISLLDVRDLNNQPVVISIIPGSVEVVNL